jgi:hypothetical protein
VKPLKDFHSIPVRIRVVDKIGKDKNDIVGYRKRAYIELKTLYSQMYHNNLQQSGRVVGIDDNVSVHCYINHGIKSAVIVVGDKAKKDVIEQVCWCCGPCLVAGIILTINGYDTDPVYTNDDSYIADIKVCQKGDETQKSKVIKEVTSREAGNSKAPDMVEYKHTNSFTTSKVIYNVPFSDRFRHKIGSTVMVLVSPIYKFSPFRYNPCINKRQLAQDGFTELTITTDFIKSTGSACKIMADKNMWTPNDRTTHDVDAMPFRILPIVLRTCLTGLSNA